MNPDIDDVGRVRSEDWHGPAHEWGSLSELAADYWRHERLSGREKEADPMFAWDCVCDLAGGSGDGPHPRVLDVIQALVDTADNDCELISVGSGPLETVLSHSGHGEALVDMVERRARQEPRFRKALSGVWLGDDVPRHVRHRLAKLGAADLVDGRPHQPGR
ncbi:MAG TPA: hypothetical protein VKB75_03500 [Jatrophihabitans sp.]|nr:hypothetical protein [Jatrophihabitans sp.]